jgi:polysaccharide export outer membrane protein
MKLSASPGEAFIIRRGPDDKPAAYAVRYDRLVRGDASADVRLAPYDLVYLPRTSVAEAFVYFNQYVQQFLPVSWGFSYQINPEAGAYPSPSVSK